LLWKYGVQKHRETPAEALASRLKTARTAQKEQLKLKNRTCPPARRSVVTMVLLLVWYSLRYAGQQFSVGMVVCDRDLIAFCVYILIDGPEIFSNIASRGERR
jgi:hypothetical protein